MSEKKPSPIVNNEEIERIIEQLPKIDYFWNKIQLYQWEGFWSTLTTVKAAMVFKATFKSKPNDVLLASFMKTGSTWLKAICVSIMQDSIKNSDNCKIIYITRNPKDTIISMWHFFNYDCKRLEDLSPLEEVVEYFCKGVHPYWEESKKMPQKILFLKYEDLKIDHKKEVAKIALFLGKPFGNEEDLEIVLNKCSLERLKNLEVNKSGSILSYAHNNAFFRKGFVGDWKNHMAPEMEEQLDKITELKLQGSGLEL
ncbi:hypothetical protein MTR67_021302 [Solanum verrucosum]|uniref:Sulfotransferase n=1 Tax=Solanum verrucosum TaxID=315347 RepID=A0AAF0QSK4_SOLVR|nr:hypothetical protein MTR67_021302 [Solanum verrucosum]